MAKKLGGAAAAVDTTTGSTWGQGTRGDVVDIGLGAAPVAPLLPRLDPSPAFVLSCHPASCSLQVDSKGQYRLVPRLTPVPIDPGVGGVDVSADGRRPVCGGALQRRRERGWIIIPPDVDAADGHPSYLRRVQVAGGKFAHMTRWETAYAGERATQRDDDAYLAWCEGLYTRGLVPRPSELTLGSMRTKLARELSAAEQQVAMGRTTTQVRSAVTALTAQIATIDKLLAGTKPTPRAAAKPEQVDVDLGEGA